MTEASSQPETTVEKTPFLKKLQWFYFIVGLVSLVLFYFHLLGLFTVIINAELLNESFISIYTIYPWFFLVVSTLSFYNWFSVTRSNQRFPLSVSKSTFLLLTVLGLWVAYSIFIVIYTVSCWKYTTLYVLAYFPPTGGLPEIFGTGPCGRQPGPQDILFFIILFLIPLFISNLLILRRFRNKN